MPVDTDQQRALLLLREVFTLWVAELEAKGVDYSEQFFNADEALLKQLHSKGVNSSTIALAELYDAIDYGIQLGYLRSATFAAFYNNLKITTKGLNAFKAAEKREDKKDQEPQG